MAEASLFNFLDAVRLRPGMYVGFDEEHRGEQLMQLVALIGGYQAAVTEHAVQDDGAAAYAGFPEYLRAKYGWSMSCGPIAAIRENSDSDNAAWDRFWLLLDDFKQTGTNAP